MRAGWAVVQDEASILVGHAAASGIPPGALAVDLCAAPGGKSGHLADRGLRVVAFDLNPRRAADITRRADAWGVEPHDAILSVPAAGGAQPAVPRPSAGWVAVAVGDGRWPAVRPGSVRVVLLDAPCTGLGVARRRPEVRWRRQPGDIEALAALQGELLDAAARLVEPGGRLLYSVCTWTRSETIDAITAFLDRHPGAFIPQAPDVAGAGTPHGPGVLLTPDRDDTDGMFLADLTRTHDPLG